MTTLSPYRFVGVLTIIYDGDELTQFGQRTMLADDVAETVLRSGGLILPEPDFFKYFTPLEVAQKTFPRFPGQWLNAPADLQAAKKAAVTDAVMRHYALVNAAEAAETARVTAIVTERAAHAAAKQKADRDLASAQAEESAITSQAAADAEPSPVPATAPTA
jgi:hypothetical protein